MLFTYHYHYEIPIKIVSLSNQREHWAARHARNKRYKKAMNLYLQEDLSKINPKLIVLTRVAPRSLDKDNLVASQKFVIDYICDRIHPGKKWGHADKELGEIFEFKQRKGAPKEYALEVEIYA
jgi:hypothetical protein